MGSKPFVRIHSLRPFKELRIIAEEGAFFNFQKPLTAATVKLLPGDTQDRHGRRPGDKIALNTAEIFGKEMVPNAEYPISPGSRMAIFTWGGCTLQVKGNVSQEYDAPNNAMKEYLNFACILDSRRGLAALRNTIGPRVLITGSASSGKSSICQILCNYAVKTSWNPLYVELDPRCSTDKESLQFLPGMIGACVMQGADDREPKNPISFYFGHLEIQEEPKLFMHLCECLSLAVHLRLAKNLQQTAGMRKAEEIENIIPLIAASGLIINAPSLATVDILNQLIDIFKVDIVVVVDNPSLKHNLAEFYVPEAGVDEEGNVVHTLDSSASTSVLGFSKMDGAVVVDAPRLRHLRRLRWHCYFHGNIEYPLKPQSMRIRFSDYTFLKFDTLANIPISALPADHIPVEREAVHVVQWRGIPTMLLNGILAVSATEDIEFVPKCNVVCILHVRNVEEMSSTNIKLEPTLVETDYILDLWCPLISDGKIFSKNILVPGDLKQLKWQADAV